MQAVQFYRAFIFYLNLMIKRVLTIIGIITGTNCPVWTQTVLIYGKVTDADTRRGLASVSIVVPKTGVTHVSGPDGTFNFTGEKKDTFFLFLPGYQTIRFSFADSVERQEYHVHFQMQMFYAESKPVIIKPKKSLSQIEAERKKLGQTPPELDPPKIEPFTSPISAIYDLLSDETRQKKKLHSQMIEDNRRRLFYALFDFYRDNKVVDIAEEHYDGFIDFLNLPIEFLKYNTDYEITKTIVDGYKRYARFSGIEK
jgi:hypothetical protein